MLNVNGLVACYQCIFALAQLALNAMKTVWRHLSEFSKQIVLNTFEHEFHIMA